LRFPEFSGEWETTSIGEQFELYSGNTPTRINKNQFNGSINWITSGELKGHYISDTKEKISEEAVRNNNLKILPLGIFVIAIYGLEADGVRSTCSITAKESTISQACMAFTSKKDIQNEFLYSWYKKHGNIIGIKYAQGTKQQNLSYDIIEKFNISYPSLEEQEKLIRFISLIDERIATQNKIIEKYESLIQAMCDTLIESEQHKVELSFSDFGESYSGLSGKSAEDFGEGCPYITYMNVNQNQIIDTTNVGLVKINEAEQQSVVRYGDILFTLSSETPEEVGMGAVYLGKTYPLYLNSFCFGVHIIDESKIFPPFLAYYISTQSFRKAVYPLAQGSTRFNLQKSDFMKKVFPFPIAERQNKIYSVLKTYSDKLSAEKSIAKLFCEQKNYLLRQLFI
jgi:type IC hsdS subunit